LKGIVPEAEKLVTAYGTGFHGAKGTQNKICVGFQVFVSIVFIQVFIFVLLNGTEDCQEWT
jgi:hypothetical protein